MKYLATFALLLIAMGTMAQNNPLVKKWVLSDYQMTVTDERFAIKKDEIAQVFRTEILKKKDSVYISFTKDSAFTAVDVDHLSKFQKLVASKGKYSLSADQKKLTTAADGQPKKEHELSVQGKTLILTTKTPLYTMKRTYVAR